MYNLRISLNNSEVKLKKIRSIKSEQFIKLDRAQAKTLK